MRFAATLIVTMVLATPAFAILRPRFPVKPSPPYRGQVIIIGEDAIKTPPKASPPKTGK